MARQPLVPPSARPSVPASARLPAGPSVRPFRPLSPMATGLRIAGTVTGRTCASHARRMPNGQPQPCNQISRAAETSWRRVWAKPKCRPVAAVFVWWLCVRSPACPPVRPSADFRQIWRPRVKKAGEVWRMRCETFPPHAFVSEERHRLSACEGLTSSSVKHRTDLYAGG